MYRIRDSVVNVGQHQESSVEEKVVKGIMSVFVAP